MSESESLAEAAERIRRAVPIGGSTATNEECALRQDLVDAALRDRHVVAGASAWHTAQLVDGRVVGVFANSAEEAELELSIWWASSCHWVVEDPECRVLDEYRVVGRAGSAQRRFPLRSPRTPRDHFAPAASLLDDPVVQDRGVGSSLRLV